MAPGQVQVPRKSLLASLSFNFGIQAARHLQLARVCSAAAPARMCTPLETLCCFLLKRGDVLQLKQLGPKVKLSNALRKRVANQYARVYTTDSTAKKF